MLAPLSRIPACLQTTRWISTGAYTEYNTQSLFSEIHSDWRRGGLELRPPYLPPQFVEISPDHQKRDPNFKSELRDIFSDKADLQVDYHERPCAIGRVNWLKDPAFAKRSVLICRSIDRSLRPLLPANFNNELSINATLLSGHTNEVDPEIVAINAASGALMFSSVPWRGPVGACKVAISGDELLVNPTPSNIRDSEMVLTVVGTSRRVLVIEFEGNEVSRHLLDHAIKRAHRECHKMIQSQLELYREVSPVKRKLQCSGADPAAADRVYGLALPRLQELFSKPVDKIGRNSELFAIKRSVEARLDEIGATRSDYHRVAGSGCVSPTDMEFAFEMTVHEVLREMILKNGLRPDGRLIRDLRPIRAETNVLPLVHGSGYFQRGETQSLCIAAVGGDVERFQERNIFGSFLKNFFVNYYFPSYCTNETGKPGYRSRREIGHSDLVEKALRRVIPSQAEFPFVVTVDATTMASNGSSSMAAVCGSSLSLADAGIPISSQVSGVSVGLVTNFSKDFLEYEAVEDPLSFVPPEIRSWCLVNDLQDIEDQHGDMDLKVAGTSKGITAIQLDTKLPGGIPLDILERAIEMAEDSIKKTLDSMQSSTLPKEQKPVFSKIDIDPESMGAIIGEKGQTIRDIGEETMSVLSSGPDFVMIYSPNSTSYDAAKTKVEEKLGMNVKKGEVYTARVSQIFDYGAFVELENGFQCFIHISDLSDERVGSIYDILEEGQAVDVVCVDRDDNGHIHLSLKSVNSDQTKIPDSS